MASTVNSSLDAVTKRIIERSRAHREAYLERVEAAISRGVHRSSLSCGNIAHGCAASTPEEKELLAANDVPNLGIISSYNDMLSAHMPFETFPALMKKAAAQAGGTAQVAGCVPAMCDGVTQGQPGMELSLFSRDVIAMAAAIGLSHNMFDAAAYLGVCDKIIPGLTIAALTFGHIPSIFVPAGPMTSGISNDEKQRVRQEYAQGKIGRDELLASEMASYHGPGTCTFYGTANSNQMMMELMGLHLPGSSFINPFTPLRDALTEAATKRALAITAQGNEFTPIGKMIDERNIVNAVVGLHATGGSTNHTMHLIAMAAAAGVQLTWQDISDLSDIVPLLARVYPNGPADVNHFHAAGGLGFLVRELLDSGLMHEDVQTVWGNDSQLGTGMRAYASEAILDESGNASWRPAIKESANPNVVSTTQKPFRPNGGLKVLNGNLGKSVIKVSAVKEEHQVVEAPAIVFDEQNALIADFEAGKLEKDFVAVVRFQGPGANGMPELHKLTPGLAVLQDKGFKVALVTDGRMSGASGKVPAAIHVTPEAKAEGPLSRIQNGDIIRLDARAGSLEVLVDAADFDARKPAQKDLTQNDFGMGRELFGVMRAAVNAADEGASVF